MWMTVMMAVCCRACPVEAGAQTVAGDTVYLRLNIDSVGLEEVVVEGRRTPPANSRWSDMHPVALADGGGFSSGGYGYSKGIDLFFRDEATVRNLTYQPPTTSLTSDAGQTRLLSAVHSGVGRRRPA